VNLARTQNQIYCEMSSDDPSSQFVQRWNIVLRMILMQGENAQLDRVWRQ